MRRPFRRGGPWAAAVALLVTLTLAPWASAAPLADWSGDCTAENLVEFVLWDTAQDYTAHVTVTAGSFAAGRTVAYDYTDVTVGPSGTSLSFHVTSTAQSWEIFCADNATGAGYTVARTYDAAPWPTPDPAVMSNVVGYARDLMYAHLAPLTSAAVALLGIIALVVLVVRGGLRVALRALGRIFRSAA